MLWHNQVRPIGVAQVLAAVGLPAERTVEMARIDLKTRGKQHGIDNDNRQELAGPVVARANEDDHKLISDADRNELPSRCEYRHRKEQCAGERKQTHNRNCERMAEKTRYRDLGHFTVVSRKLE